MVLPVTEIHVSQELKGLPPQPITSGVEQQFEQFRVATIAELLGVQCQVDINAADV
jgi:hypothetical protein